MAASAKLAPQAGGAAGRKYGGGVTQDILSADMAVDQELHLKMSKKIAQLTKVIYALNTKNDEHEHIVKAIQLQHDKDVQQLMADTKTKLESFKAKVNSEAELRRRIEGLELCVDEHEKQRKRLLQDAELVRRDSAERESALRAEHAQSVVGLSKELARVQSDYEVSVSKFRRAFEAIERDKAEAIADMRKAHQIETEQLLRAAQSALSSDADGALERARSAHAAELATAAAELDRERQERRELAAECEQKLDAARALHARELEAARGALSRTADERARLLQEQCDRLLKDAQLQESLHRRRIDELVERLGSAEEGESGLRAELERSRAAEGAAGARLATAETRLAETNKAAEQLRSLYEKTASDLTEAGERSSSQAAQLRAQSARLAESEALHGALQKRVQQLLDDLAASSRKLASLESERDELLSHSRGAASETSSRVAALEQMVEGARSEVTALHKQHSAELAQVQANAEREMERHRILQEQLLAEVARLKAEAEEARVRATAELDQLEKTWKQRVHELLEKHKAETALLAMDLESGSANLRSKLVHAEAEVQRLTEAVLSATSGLDLKSAELAKAHQRALAAEDQLKSTSAALAAAETLAARLQVLTSLQAENEELRIAGLQQEEQHRDDVRRRLGEQAAQLNAEWADKLRAECERLRQDLLAQATAERAAAERQLSEASERSTEALRRRLEARAAELEARAAQLDAALGEQRHAAAKQLAELRAELERRIAELLAEHEHAVAELCTQLDAARAGSDEQARQAQLRQEQELKELARALKAKHVEDLQAQMAAHRAALAVAQKEAADARTTEIAAKTEAFTRDLDAAKRDLQRAHADEMEGVSQNANRQIAAIRMELQRAVELKAQKEREFLSAAEEMNAKLSAKEAHIRNMEASIQKYLQSIEQLNKELDSKGKEVLKVRSDANQQLRRREESLLKEHRAESDKLAAEHSHQVQRMLEDFNQAQDMLKEKIAALQIMLEEAEERYRNRESRPEDLDAIEHLKELVGQLEAEVQKLLEEKRYYQMELVNRETNFNKVFSASPQVGFINPLAKKKKGDKGPTKYTVSSPVIGASSAAMPSSATSNGRLRPIAGSPVHDEPLNPNHVLPPPQAFAKRFVQ